MSDNGLTIRDIKARAVVAPLKRPIRTAVGTIPSAPLVLIDVSTEEDVTGRAYLFAYTTVALAPLVRLIEEVGRELKGKSAAPRDAHAAISTCASVCSAGRGSSGWWCPGLDMAFWDAPARALELPVASAARRLSRPVAGL